MSARNIACKKLGKFPHSKWEATQRIVTSRGGGAWVVAYGWSRKRALSNLEKKMGRK